MSETHFNLIPPELVRIVCCKMELEDIISLRDTNQRIKPVIDLMFFKSIHKMHVYWRSDGTTVTLTGPSLPGSFSISSHSFCFEDVLRLCKFTRSLTITKEDDAKDHSILQLLAKEAYQLTRLEILLRKGKREVSPQTMVTSFVRLTSFVRQYRTNLRSFRMETDETNYIEFKSDCGQSVLDFHQTYQSDICRQLVLPLMQQLIEDNENMSEVTIKLDTDRMLNLTLQAAFHCIPYNRRQYIHTLRLEFGASIASLNHTDTELVLASFAPHLSDTRNLKQLKCILTESKLNPARLESLYKLISSEMCGEKYRISLVLAPLKDETPTFKCNICNSVISVCCK